MVKSIISSIVALFIIFSANAYEQHVVMDTFSTFNHNAKIVYKKTENQTAIKEDILSLQKFWIEKKHILHVFIPHNEIKEIELWLAESSTLIENEKYEDALSKLDVVIELTEQIPKTFLFKLENIL